MELYNALKKVVELQSEEILKDVKLINILSDFRAYDDMPSSKYLLKFMISEGLMANLLYEYQSQNDVNTLLNSHKTLLSDTYGYKECLADNDRVVCVGEWSWNIFVCCPVIFPAFSIKQIAELVFLAFFKFDCNGE